MRRRWRAGAAELSEAAVGEATRGEEAVILLGEEGRRCSGRMSVGCPRRWRRSTGIRSGALADDGGALVEVGGALLENGGVVGGATTLGAKFWQPDDVVSFRAET
jgi:hypothetical protein